MTKNKRKITYVGLVFVALALITLLLKYELGGKMLAPGSPQTETVGAQT